MYAGGRRKIGEGAQLLLAITWVAWRRVWSSEAAAGRKNPRLGGRRDERVTNGLRFYTKPPNLSGFAIALADGP